jgi:16S rRNA (cytosine1402-N4)-methyltransferase
MGAVPGTDGQEGGYHVPVMLREAVDALAVRPDGVYVDCTFGGGGHSRSILERLGPEGRLVAFDQDADARRNLPDDGRLLFVQENFRHVGRFLRVHGLIPVDGVLADLGVSSHQFDEGSRGFSIRSDAPLDMRMDRRQPLTAADWLRDRSEAELQDILGRYGEVPNARTLAAAIVAARRLSPIEGVRDLLDVLEPLSKGNPHRYRAQVFQALRMAVNDETGALEDMLSQMPGLIRRGGRLVVITFHSLEDRIVKRFMRGGDGGDDKVDVLYGTRPEAPFEPLFRKPQEATEEETRMNPRSRSARLRAAVRT